MSRNEKKKDSPKKNMGKTTSALMEEEMHKRKIKEMNLQQNVGFSFGIKNSLNPNMKLIRRQNSQKVKKHFDNFFDLENITMKTKYPLLTDGDDNNNNENLISENSIRDVLQEKKNNLTMLKKAKREKKLAKVKMNQTKISNELSRKNELFYSKIEKENLEDSKTLESKKFSVTIDNYNNEENNVGESQISESPSKKEIRMNFLNQRYNIENIKTKHSNKENLRKKEFITPGPGMEN